MEGRKITREDRSCISNCIFQYWGNPGYEQDDEKRDKDYEDCLTNCRICA